MPAQTLFGHLEGDCLVKHQPSKIAAIEGRWDDEQPAGEVLFGIPDENTRTTPAE